MHLISLGSSFAAGPGIPPLSSPTAKRSSLNYPSLLSSHFRFTHTDLTVSGATLSNITSEPQTLLSTTFAPQLTGVPEDADIITLTAGGNDLKYVGGLMRDEFRATWLGWLSSFVMSAGEEEPRCSVEELAESFIAVLDAIHAKAPKAKIYLVEYLTLLSPSTKSGIHVSMNGEKISQYQGVAHDLHRAYNLAADAREWCTLVDVAERSKDHGIGMQDAWVEGLGLGSTWRGNPMHPNARGMRAVADMLIERLEGAGVVVK